LCKSSRADKTATVIRKIFEIILWLAAGAYGVVGVLAITGALGSAREAASPLVSQKGRDGGRSADD
jgi:hypothetical protein